MRIQQIKKIEKINNKLNQEEI